LKDKPHEMQPLRSRTTKWEDNIKINVGELRDEDRLDESDLMAGDYRGRDNQNCQNIPLLYA
jgi:hypothetical protein